MLENIQEDFPTRGFRSAYLCHKTRVTWSPKWEDTECGECGHVTGQIDVNEPDFHGSSKWVGTDLVCSRCGDILPDLEKVNKVAMEQLAPQMMELVSKRSPMLCWLKRGGRFR